MTVWPEVGVTRVELEYSHSIMNLSVPECLKWKNPSCICRLKRSPKNMPSQTSTMFALQTWILPRWTSLWPEGVSISFWFGRHWAAHLVSFIYVAWRNWCQIVKTVNGPICWKICKRQIGSSPQLSGWKYNNIWVATTQLGFRKNTLGLEVWRGDPKKHTIQTIKPQEGFAWNMRGWILRKEHVFFTGSMGTYMNLPETSSTSRYCIPFIDPICFFQYFVRWVTHPNMDPTGTKNYSNVLAFFQFGMLGFAGLALGKCSKHTLPTGGAYLVGDFNPPEKY